MSSFTGGYELQNHRACFFFVAKNSSGEFLELMPKLVFSHSPENSKPTNEFPPEGPVPVVVEKMIISWIVPGPIYEQVMFIYGAFTASMNQTNNCK